MMMSFLLDQKANGGPVTKSVASKKQKQQQQRIRKKKPQQHNFTHHLLAAALKVGECPPECIHARLLPADTQCSPLAHCC